MISKIALFFCIYLQTAAGCSNGLGGKFSCHLGMSDKEIALSACESVYGSCTGGICGYFRYYKASGHKSCDCHKSIGQYEFIYHNGGYQYVGQDYGGTTDNVAGNGLFVRKKTSGCNGKTPWQLVYTLGRDITAFPTETPTATPTETGYPTEIPTIPTERPTNIPSRIPCKDQFPWCVVPNICDDVDFRVYCPFSCDDCLTAGPTIMPTASPTEDCAARESVLEGVIDHMLNYYTNSGENEESSESSK